MKRFEGLKLRYVDDGSVDVVMIHPEGNKEIRDIMRISGRNAVGMAFMLVRCAVKAYIWSKKKKHK